MSDFIIHGIPGSPFMRSVCVAMEEKGAPYRIAPMALGAMRTEAGLKLHPFGRIPAIEHGDYRLYETQAILRYIDAKFDGPALQPDTPEAIGRMNQIVGINDWYLFPQIARVIGFQRVIGPAIMGIAPDEAAIAAAMPDARRCFAELERLLGANAFFAGDAISLADIQLAPQLYYLALTRECGALMKGTALAAWMDRMNARASMRNTLPPEPLRKAA